MSEQPIVILCIPRSGSSMTAGVFAEHGVWAGECMPADPRNPKGFFENVQIKRHMARLCGRSVSSVYPPVSGWRRKVERIIASEGYAGGPWLVKHNVAYHRIWDEYDEPAFILPRRDSEAIFRSVRCAGFNGWQTDDELRASIEQQQAMLDGIDGYEVDTDAVAGGDLTTIIGALEYAGIESDLDIIGRFVDPSLWHHPAGEDEDE